jgi:AraC-like DNA-binding protein
VIALVTGRADAVRITAALRPMSVLIAATLDELRSAFADAEQQCAGMLIEARDVNGESTSAFIGSLAQQHRIPVLGYVSSGALYADAMRELARAGVHDLVFREADDCAALLGAKFARGEESRAASTVLSRIAEHTPRRLMPVAEYVLNFPRDKYSVAKVASAIGVNRKTLTNWCARQKCPPPGIIITWCRLLLAAELLQIPGRTVERTVNALDFASASSFRNLCQKYLRRRPSTLSAPGALDEAYVAYACFMAPSDERTLVATRLRTTVGMAR